MDDSKQSTHLLITNITNPERLQNYVFDIKIYDGTVQHKINIWKWPQDAYQMGSSNQNKVLKKTLYSSQS